MTKNNADKKKDKTPRLITKLLPENKAVALSLAVSLALSGMALPASALDANKTWDKKDMVLVQEEDDENAVWETDGDNGYSYYGNGHGYSYRPFYYSGIRSRSANWSSAKTTKSVGGYHLSVGHVGS